MYTTRYTTYTVFQVSICVIMRGIKVVKIALTRIPQFIERMFKGHLSEDMKSLQSLRPLLLTPLPFPIRKIPA